jgi:GLPGLI family protein
MKKYALIAVILCVNLFVFAQNTEGVITYSEKINMHRRLPNPEMKAYVPEFRTSKMELYFKGDECVYKAPEDEDDEDMTAGGGGMQMRFRRPSSEIYRNFATDARIEQRDVMGKKYLISDTMKIRAWKLTTDTKKILNYDCIKATLDDTARKQKIVVWFTDAIALTAGPNTIGSLPGMVLGVDINEGETVITATNIAFKPVKADDIKAPSKGEKITEPEYRKKMEEMMQRNGGSGMRIIRN